MKRIKRSVLIVTSLIVVSTFNMPYCAIGQDKNQNTELTIQINGAKKYQTMDGFGVNINTVWWYNGEYGDGKLVQPALDLLVDSLGATIFRAVIEEMDWEAVNDNNDPNNFNWTYYNSVFSDIKFQGIWNTLRYLNQKGITNGLIISFMGSPPASAPMTAIDPQKSWMGNKPYSIDPAKEDEFVETIAALLYYARNTAKVQFTLVSPMNETDIVSDTKGPKHPDGIVEGPDMPDPVQFTRVIKKLAERLDAIGMKDIRFVTPDAAGNKLFGACMDEIVKDSYLMGKLACWGVHQYGKDSRNYQNTVGKTANPNKSFWVTETAGIRNVLGQLDNDPKALIFWDGFDCVYQHGRRNGYGDIPPNDYLFSWKEEGKPLIEYIASTQSWKPRKQFYEHEQLMKFIKPGAVRIEAAGSNNSMIVHAFSNPNGQLVIVGRNNGSSAVTVNGKLSNITNVSAFKVYRTNVTQNLQLDAEINPVNGAFNLLVSPGTTFTLTGVRSKN
jgi:O-glycosyl hydrolase